MAVGTQTVHCPRRRCIPRFLLSAESRDGGEFGSMHSALLFHWSGPCNWQRQNAMANFLLLSSNRRFPASPNTGTSRSSVRATKAAKWQGKEMGVKEGRGREGNENTPWAQQAPAAPRAPSQCRRAVRRPRELVVADPGDVLRVNVIGWEQSRKQKGRRTPPDPRETAALEIVAVLVWKSCQRPRVGSDASPGIVSAGRAEPLKMEVMSWQQELGHTCAYGLT
ncbi:hypothetical protein C8R47DRAFT_1081658 [Mycena vitilis]|nr:hypothetical protein C8R47DRAFT_1081658 [Mycena vitilis]